MKNKKKTILREAEKLFTSRRFHEVRLDEVASAAHVGKGTIYRHFKDKDDLFFRVATSGFDELMADLDAALVADCGFQAKLEKVCADIMRFYGSRGKLFRMLYIQPGSACRGKAAIKKELKDQWGRLVKVVVRILEEGVKPGEVPADLLAVYLLGMLRTWAYDLKNAPDRFRRVDILVKLFLEGVGLKAGADASEEIVVDTPAAEPAVLKDTRAC